MPRMRIRLLCFIFGLIFVNAFPLHGQKTLAVQQEVIPVAYIFERQLITSIIESNLIPADPDSVTKIRFIDITSNGFGDNDLLTLYPSKQTYPFIVDSLLSNEIRSWRFNTGHQLVTQNRAPEFFEQMRAENPQLDAENWILAGILRALNQCYTSLPVKLYFERDPSGTVRLDMWGMDTTTAAFSRPEALQQATKIAVDTVFVVQRDTIFVSKQE